MKAERNTISFKKVKKLLFGFMACVFTYLIFLVISITLFLKSPPESAVSPNHPVFLHHKMTTPYILTRLDSDNYADFDRAYFYFIVINNEKASDKIRDWAKSDVPDKRALCFRYFARNHTLKSDNKISAVAKENHQFYIDAWNAETHLMPLHFLAQAICLSDIPLDDLSNDYFPKRVYLDLCELIRANDSEGINKFLEMLETLDPKWRKRCELILAAKSRFNPDFKF